jgi:hypothetical protein
MLRCDGGRLTSNRLLLNVLLLGLLAVGDDAFHTLRHGGRWCGFGVFGLRSVEGAGGGCGRRRAAWSLGDDEAERRKL